MLVVICETGLRIKEKSLPVPWHIQWELTGLWLEDVMRREAEDKGAWKHPRQGNQELRTREWAGKCNLRLENPTGEPG